MLPQNQFLILFEKENEKEQKKEVEMKIITNKKEVFQSNKCRSLAHCIKVKYRLAILYIILYTV